MAAGMVMGDLHEKTVALVTDMIAGVKILQKLCR
jgi:hypothetical protein